MKKMLPDALGTAGFCLFVFALYTLWGQGVALGVAGVLMMVGAFLAGSRLKGGDA